MGSIDLVTLLLRWVHIGCAATLIGGALFSGLALWPGADQSLDSTQRQELRTAVGRRWSKVVFSCIGLLLITGLANFYILALKPEIEAMPYHALFLVKVLIAMVLFFIASAVVGRSPAFENMRKRPAFWHTLLAALGLFLILLSGVLSQVRAG